MEPAEVGRNYKKTVGMDGDAKKTPEILYDTVSSLMPARSGRTSEHAQQQPLAGFVGAIRNAVPDDGILISGMTQVRTDAVSVLRGFFQRISIMFLISVRNHSNRWPFVLALILLSGLGGCDRFGNEADQSDPAYQQQLEALSARLGSLESAIQQQATILRQILDHVSPPQLSPEWQNRLKQLESQVGNVDQWPKDAGEAEQFFDQTSELVTGLPAWAEAQYLPRLSLVRWSAMAFTQLNHSTDTSQSLDQLADEMRDLADVKPQGGSEALVQRLREKAVELAGRVTNRRVTEAIREAQQYLRGGSDLAPDIVNVYEFLGLYEKDHDLVGVHVNIARLRKEVYKEMMRRQAGEQAAVLRAQWQNVGKLAHHQPQYEVSVRMLLQQVVSAHAVLILEGIATTAYDELENEMRRAVETIESKAAERAEKRQAQAMRSYQRWALSNIKAFEAAFQAISHKAAEAASILRRDDGGWRDAYQEVRQAMIVHLLPINLALLDLPVQERYHQAFQTGWKKLDGRADQTAVAQASALTVKKSLRVFLED